MSFFCVGQFFSKKFDLGKLISKFQMDFVFFFTSCIIIIPLGENGTRLPLHVQVDDCEESPCALVRGTDVNVNTTFVARKYEFS